MNVMETKTIERDGRGFEVSIYSDDDAGEPWSREDGHGPVSDWERRSKAPGEVILASDRGDRHRFYDMQDAVAIALRDGWGSAGDEGMSRKAKAAKAAREDFERLRAWCRDDWHYVGVVVRPACDKCGEVHGDDYTYAVWGIESDSGDYLDEVANELIDECLATESVDA